MTDLTPIVSNLITSASPSNATTVGAPYTLAQLNDFLQEAYQIAQRASELLAYLRTIRQPYLSTAPPPRRRQLNTARDNEPLHLTDTQRDAIDAEAKSVLRDLHSAVNNLRHAEDVRQQTEEAVASRKRWRDGGGMLGFWAAGGAANSDKSAKEEEEDAKRNTIKAHREGVVWFLQRRLEVCGEVQGEMMEVRIQREVEKSRSVLYKTKGVAPIAALEPDPAVAGANGSMPLQEMEKNWGGGEEDDLDDEQMQVFARENKNMVKHYENKLDQVRTAERSLLEISELQSQLATNLEIQSAHIDQLVQDSFQTEQNVGQGNKELKKASERKSTAKFVFWGTVGLCSVVVIWDLLI